MSASDTSAVQYDRDLCSLKYILRAGHDLYRLAADIHLADNQLIRIRMFFDLVDLSDHDFFQICIQFFKSLYFCS